MARGGVKGGKRYKRTLRNMERRGKELAATTAEVGYFEPHVAQIAMLHEFGSKPRGAPRLPERPAFRGAMPAMGKAMVDAIKVEVGTGRGVPSKAALEVGARGAKEALAKSYANAPGPDVGPRQQARKVGTPGADKLLVGREGPKLIDHISAEVNGDEVE